MNNIVGGIYYIPNKRQNLDIYENPIELSNLVSYRNQPIKVDEEIKEYQPKYSFTPRVTETVAPKSVILNSEIKPGSHKIESGVQVGNMQTFLDEAAKHGVYFRVTSGLRSGAKTSSGKTS